MPASDLEVAQMERNSALVGTESNSDEEADISQTRGIRRSFRLSAGALVLLFGAAVIMATIVATRSPLFKTEAGARSSMKEEIIVQKPIAFCSNTWKDDPVDDCGTTKCCKVSGQVCFEKQPGVHGCVEACNPAKGWTCQVPSDMVPLSEVRSHSSLDAKFYCFSVYTKDIGSAKKPSHELELLQQQYQQKVSIFACDYYDVFSDVVAPVGPDYPTIKVDDVNHDFHLIKRRKSGTWVNTGMFKQVWKAIAKTLGAKKVEWVVKVDADAVFIPHRLKGKLMGHPITNTGIYIENCNSVEWGYFGNLEIFNIQAFNTLLANIDSCSEKIDWVKGTKWGPIGEDLFAQMCMDDHGVSKVQDFGVTTDAMCPGTRKRWGQTNNTKWKPPCNLVGTPALHPFKKPEEYFQCLYDTQVLG